MTLPRFPLSRPSTAPCLAFVLSLTLASAASAADLTLLCAGAMKAPISALLAQRDPALPHVAATYATAGVIRERIEKGERPDVVIGPSDTLFALMKENKIDVSTRHGLGITEIGVAVKAGAPLPSIATGDALRKTLLAARKVVIVDAASGTSGRLMEDVFQSLGIADAMRDKLIRVPGGNVVEAVARGEADLGFQQISAILPVAGVRLVGPLPGELQRLTRYDVAVVAGTPRARDARNLVDSLGAPDARAVIVRSGFTATR